MKLRPICALLLGFAASFGCRNTQHVQDQPAPPPQPPAKTAKSQPSEMMSTMDDSKFIMADANQFFATPKNSEAAK